MKPWLKLTLKILAGLVAAIVLLVLGVVIYVSATWDKPVDRPVREMTASMDSATIAHGEFLFKYSTTCWMCHSPRRSIDGLPSGGAVEDLRDFGPGFGLFYMKNITPDKETGIGTWTDGEIVRAIREGIGKDGHAFFIMPSRAFNRMSDEDALAIAAYLKSLPPVKNPLAAHEYSFFTKALYTFGMIKPQPQVTEPVVAPPRGATVEWGKYLANHRALCTDCHTPFDQNTGTFFEDSLFVGGNFPIGQPLGKMAEEEIDPIWAYGPNLTPDSATGIGTWTEDDFVAVLKSGVGPDGRTRVATAMPYPYYKLWDEIDLRAMYRYLRTLEPVRKAVPPNIIYSKAIKEGSGVGRGKALFRSYCQPCHGVDGTGAPATKVTMSEVVHSIDDVMLKDFVRKGQMNLWMPAFGKTLTEDQLGDVLAFIRSWDGQRLAR